MKLILLLVLSCSLNFAYNQNYIFDENFDSGELTEDWKIIDNDGNTVHSSVSELSEAWTVIEDPQDTNNFIVASTSYFDPLDSRASRWLITPKVKLGSWGNFISWYARSQDASFADSYKVMISVSGGEDVDDFTELIAEFSPEEPEWNKREFMIDEQFADSTVRFAFVNNTFNGFKLYLDTIQVREEDPLSTQEFQAELNDKITVYPNPTTDKIFFKGGEFNTLRVNNINGKEVLKSHSKIDQLSLESLPNGIYFISFISDNYIIRKKVIKQ